MSYSIQRASIEANSDFIWIFTESKLGLWRPDFAVVVFRFKRDVNSSILGQSVLAALAKSRQVEDLKDLSGGMNIVERIRLWEKEQMATIGYATLRAMYRNMMNVSVKREEGTITFTPMRHDKLQAWEGFRGDDTDHQPVIIDANDSPEVVGGAALQALSRCM